MKTEPLQSLLPGVLRTRPDVCSSADRLLSFCRVYTALSEFVAATGLEREYGSKGEHAARVDELLRVICCKTAATDDLASRAALVSAMYALVCETSFVADRNKLDECCGATLRLIEDYAAAGKPHGLVQTGICRCISDMFYPEIPDDACFAFFRDCVREWADTLSASGCWEDVGFDVALERIGVMNRNSYMFLDKTYDAHIRRASDYYRQRIAIPEDPRNFDGRYLPTLGRLYDLVLEGNACIVDRQIAERVVRFMYRYSHTLPVGDDAWLRCMSYVVHHAAGQAAMRTEAEMERHIA